MAVLTKANMTRADRLPLRFQNASSADAAPHLSVIGRGVLQFKDAKRTPRRHKGMIVGFARRSTTDQAAGLAAQERDLTAAAPSASSANNQQRRQAGEARRMSRLHSCARATC